MVNRFNTILLTTVAGSMILQVSCRKELDVKKKEEAPPAETQEPAEPDVSKVEASKFTDLQASGRKQIFATFRSIGNVNFTRVHPSTQAFYGISTVNDVVMTQDPAHTEILYKFSNIQEAATKPEILAAAQRVCKEEGFTSLKQCLDEAIKRSGAIVFQPKTKLTTTTNVNDPNLLWDVLDNMLGITPVRIETNPAQDGYMLACSSCHASGRTLTNASGAKKLTVDLRGDSALADGKKTIDPADYIQRSKAVVNNPSDPIWAVSNRTKAAGLLAAQYLHLQQTQGQNYALSESHITKHLKDASVSRYVNIGWVFAMLSASTTARVSCNGDTYGGGIADPRCHDALDDNLVAKRTERATLEHFMVGGSRYNITQAFLSKGDFALVPDRPMRSLLPLTGSDYYDVYNPTFALEYMTFSPYNQFTNRNQINSRYLLGATAGAAVMPANYELGIARAWLGSAATSATAADYVNTNLERVVLRNYAADSLAYHSARFSQTAPVAKDFAPVVTKAELQKLRHYLVQTCYTCHSNSTIFITDNHWNACANGAECEIRSIYWRNASSAYGNMYSSPTADYASVVFKSINSTPEPLSGLDYTQANHYIKSKPGRIPLLNRHSLTDWSYTSFADALAPTPPAAQYGVLSPIVSYNGVTQFRTQYLNFSLGFGSGTQQLRCLETAKFDLNGDGIAESSCQDTLKAVSGYTPRLIGKSDAVTRHATVARPTAYETTADAVNRFLHGLDVGMLKVTDGSVTKYFRFKFEDSQSMDKVSYDYDYMMSSGSYYGSSGGYSGYGGGGYGGGGY